jgi:hypothetical protein
VAASPPVAGIAIGGLVAVAAAAAWLFFGRRRRHPRKSSRGLSGGDLTDPLLEHGFGGSIELESTAGHTIASDTSASSFKGCTSPPVSLPSAGAQPPATTWNTSASDTSASSFRGCTSPPAALPGAGVGSQPSPGYKAGLQDSGGYTSSTGGSGFSVPPAVAPGTAAPVKPAEYDDITGAPVNTAAKKEVAREWKAAVQAGALPRVVQLPFEILNRVTDDFNETNQVGGGASCAVFRCFLFGVPVAVKLLKAAAVEWEAKQFESERCVTCALVYDLPALCHH